MAKDGEVKLLGIWSTPFVLRARIALNLKHVSFEFLEEDLPFRKSQLLLDSNPVHKKVPVLLHNGKPICESLIIVEYIDEVWASAGAPAILPSDPYDRATARFWAAYVDEKIFLPIRGINMVANDEQQKALLDQIVACLELLEEAFQKCSKGGKFFGEERIGFLDIALGSLLGWLRVLERSAEVKLLHPSKTPKLVAWTESFCKDEAVKEVMPETDKLAEFAMVIHARMRAASAASH